MKKKRYITNPFIYEGYEGPEYFCDRENEVQKVISHLQNGRNITLVSPRKIGKTGLIKHVFYKLKQTNKDIICIYTDIFHTQNQYDLAQTLGKAIIQERLLNKPNAKEKVLSFFGMWRPSISFDPLTGNPSISVSIERTNIEHSIESIFDYLKSCGKEIYFAIDEFQTIADYPEKGTEALLRSHIQFMSNVHFIFSGSKQHMMYEMFGSPKRPFYQSTAMMSLGALNKDTYYEFASNYFKKRGGDFSRSVFYYLYEMFDGYTWYLQSVLNRLYEYEKKVTDTEQVKNALDIILKDKTDQYATIMTFLSGNQRNLLKAVAKESIVAQPQSNSFIQLHNLSSSSSVKKALTSLIEKDLVYRTNEGYIIYDRFFDLWLKRL